MSPKANLAVLDRESKPSPRASWNLPMPQVGTLGALKVLGMAPRGYMALLARLRRGIVMAFAAVDDAGVRSRAVGIIRELIARAEARR